MLTAYVLTVLLLSLFMLLGAYQTISAEGWEMTDILVVPGLIFTTTQSLYYLLAAMPKAS